MILVNADDFGASHEVNSAILELFRKGLLDRTTILMNAPFTDEAIEMAQKNGFADSVGLHLNLTSGAPLTKEAKESNLCIDGIYKNIFLKKPLSRFYLCKKDRCAVEKEVEAQMKKYIDSGFSLAHVDSHHHVHTNISVLKIIINLAKKNGFSSMRVCRNYPGISEPTIKSLYKKYVNSKISVLNEQAVKKHYLLSLNELSCFDSNGIDNICEVECHPYLDGTGYLRITESNEGINVLESIRIKHARLI